MAFFSFGYGLGDPSVLPGASRSVASFHCCQRRSWRRFEVAGSIATQDCGHQCRSSSHWHRTFYHDPSKSSGIGFQVREEDAAFVDGRELRYLGGSTPMGTPYSNSSTSTKCLGVDFNNGWPRRRSEEDEVRQCAGSGRRVGVLDPGRSNKSRPGAEVHGCNRWFARRRGGAFKRTIVSVVSKDIYAQCPSVCRLLGVHPIREKDYEGVEISKLHTHRRWVLCGQGIAWPSKLCSVVGLLQSVAGGHDHVGHDFFSQPSGLRALHGEVEQVVSVGMASAGPGRRQREIGTFESVATAGHDRTPEGRKSSTGVATVEAVVGPHLQAAHRGWGLLGRECAQPSTCVDGAWVKGFAEDTRGEGSHHGNGSGSCSPTPASREGSRSPWRRRTQETDEQGEKGSKEKKDKCRSRRTGSAPGRTKGWWKSRERKRKIKRRGGAVVFRMEQQQQQRSVQGCATRRRMSEQSEEGSQMHEVWEPWTSIAKLFSGMIPGGETPEDGADAEERGEKKRHHEGDGGDASREGKRKKGEEGGGAEREGGKKDKRSDEKPLNVEEMTGTFEEYLEERMFTFLHHYSGSEDVLSEALVRACCEAGLLVKVIGVDRDRGPGWPKEDLLEDEPFKSHLEDARAGKLDGYHAGFPCSTFSRLRWRECPGMPRAVRSRMEPLGCKDNSVREQEECDRGTIMMARSIMMSKAMEDVRGEKKVGPFSCLENPPPSDHPEHVAAWEMEEMKNHVEKYKLTTVIFNTCAYEPELEIGKKHFKPQQMVGSLVNLSKLRRSCGCGDARHDAVVGSKKSKASARYPKAMCEEYAKLVVAHFIRMAKAEYYEMRAKAVQIHLRKMRLRLREVEAAAGAAGQDPRVRMEGKGEGGKSEGSSREEGQNAASSSRRREGDMDGEEGEEGREVEKGWKQGPGKFGVLRPSRSKKEDPGQHGYLGGMRNPAASVRSLPGAQHVGSRIQKSWERMVKMRPKVLELSVNYGTQEGEIDEELVKEWRAELRQLLGAEPEEKAKLVEKGGYRSEVEAGLLEGWNKKSGDPDIAVAKWVRQGAPLGIEQKIDCHGVFPPSGEQGPERESEEATSYLTRGDLLNYASVEDNKTHARDELRRYEENGYMRRLTVEEANSQFKKRTLSKLGLILKEREDKTLKKRIVIDLRRSGGNDKAHLPERLILPRPWDCVLMTRELRATAPKADCFTPEDRCGAEYAVVDITDAFMSYGLHPSEWGHALTPSTEEGECLLFVAMLFGYKTAPLVFSRLAALVARLVQAGLDPAVAVHQVYLDDSIFYMQGSLKARDAALSYVLYTMAALGLRVSYKKGKRGCSVQWVGITFKLAQDGNLVMGLPMNFLQETAAVLKRWKSAGYAPLKELRSMAGRMSWTAGVLPRAKWTVGVLYAVMHQEEEGQKERKKGKKGLFPVRRLEQARAWLVVFLDVAIKKPMRVIPLKVGGGPKVVITTDASPGGLGGVLSVNGVILQAFKSEVTEEDAERHSFTWGSSASQGVVESLSILVAMRLWKANLPPGAVDLALQSDSITALALTQRLGASTPALNHLGGEIGLVMEELCLEKVRPVHVPGPANGLADYLSRPEKMRKQSLPADLKEVKVISVEARSDSYFLLPLPKDNPTLWGCSEVLPPHTVWDSLQ